MRRPFKFPWLQSLGIALIVAVAACGTDTPYDNSNYPKDGPRAGSRASGSVLGDGGITLFGGGGGRKTDEGGAGIGVNSFLWRASLDTLAFMPLASADPFGGVIITDWYTPPETPNDRMKVNVYILDRTLRADGVRASVFRQSRTPDGRWVDATVEPGTVGDLENAILTRARQLRIATAQR